MPSPLAPIRLAGAAAICSALVLALGCSPIEPEGEEEAADFPGTQVELDFDTAAGTVYATLALPEEVEGSGAPVPGVVIVSGSGPTDRDGNSELRPDAGTNANFAAVLAEAGVASLRYDKLGSGETGTGDRDPEDPVDFAVFEEQMAAAYARLAARSEVDPDRLAVLGHSEGALFALRAPHAVEQPPAALILAAPLGTRYLDLVDRQVTEAMREAEAAGQVDTGEVGEILSDTRYAAARLRSDGEVPEGLHPMLESLFSEASAPFLREADALDPQEVAADLPEGTPSLVLWGTEDAQVTSEEVDHLMAGLAEGTRVDLPATDHVFRVYDDSPGAPVLDADRPFSPDVAPAVEEFLAELGW